MPDQRNQQRDELRLPPTINVNVRNEGNAEIIRLLNLLVSRQLKIGDIIMAIGQDILTKVTAQTTAVDSLITLMQGLIDNGTIPPDVGAQIISTIDGSKAKVDAAIVANTPAAP